MNNQSTIRLESLYRRWSASGVGFLLSGNVQVDRMHLERLDGCDARGQTALNIDYSNSMHYSRMLFTTEPLSIDIVGTRFLEPIVRSGNASPISIFSGGNAILDDGSSIAFRSIRRST